MLLSLFAIGTMINTRGVVYSLGIEDGNVSEFIYEVKIVNEEDLESVLGTNWVSEIRKVGGESIKGAKEKYIINDIEGETTYWRVRYRYWDWTVTDFDELPDAANDNFKLYKDPTDINYFFEIYRICPTPVGYYLQGAFGQNPDHYIVEDNTVTTNPKHFMSQKYDIKITFDTSTGLLDSYEWIYGGKIIFEIGQYNAIPGYDPPIFLGIIAISTIGLIYMIMKKK